VKGIVALILLLGGAATASAQSISAQSLKVDFSGATPVVGKVNASFAPEVVAVRQGGTATPSWAGFVQGGLAFGGGGGFAVGGGVIGDNFLSNEKYALSIDGYYANVGGGCGFDVCDVTQIAVGVDFLYKFNKSNSGWRPFVGGGLVYSQVNFSFDDDLFGCDLLGIDCDTSDGAVGIEVAGGVEKEKLAIVIKLGGVHGGGGAVLVRYRFKPAP
jgi:hypothetical protein